MTQQLHPWGDIKAKFEKCTLLLGNGASMAVWKKFSYPSLYDYARDADMLSSEDQAFFDSANTRNFEQVLSNLKISQETCKILNLPHELIEARYNSIRDALVSAVNDIHVDWRRIASISVLSKIRKILKEYKFIFSTNYDLLAYWSRMKESNGKGFTDYFFNGTDFDITNTEIWKDDVTSILYLHGALHLYVDPLRGSTHKHIHNPAGYNIQQLFSLRKGVPLFVSEGSSTDKLRSINRSDYLSFVYQKFIDNRLPVVIFGQSLAKEYDNHILSAINSWKGHSVPVAISIYPSGDALADQKRMTDLALELRAVSPIFFDSRTHPLGAPDLQVSP